MSSKFDELRQELDLLGYKQKLHPECIPLVQKLLADLNTTTTNLQKYMKISQHALEERDILEFGTEPYKCDNAKLSKECNDLHIAFIHFKEQHERTQRELRQQISVLQIRLENCNLEKSRIMSQLQQLEKEKYRKASKSGLSKDQNGGKQSKPVEMADETVTTLNKEVKDLKEKYSRVAEDNVILQNQLTTREEEIIRLQSLLQGGRPSKAISKDCCYQNVDGQVGLLQSEVTRLKKEKTDFLKQVKEALAKQHEAMRRALHLAERNRQLEKEMRDIDEIALAVESECNNTVKDNSEKVTRLQDRINESLILIQNLERDSAKSKQDKVKLSADLDAIKLEKIHLQKQLDNETEDKKRLTDRINNFSIIENDLNLEIDRLTTLTSEQKRRIFELESQISTDRGKSTPKGIYRDDELDGDEPEMSDKILQTDKKKGNSKQKVEHKKNTKKVSKGKAPSKSSSPSKISSPDKSSSPDKADSKEPRSKCCCESGTCVKNLKDLLDREMEYRQAQAMQSIETLKQEKEYYMREYHKSLEQMRNIPTHERPDSVQSLANMQELMECKQQVKEKEMRIKELENEIRQIRSSVLTGQEVGMDSSICNNPKCKRKEREMDMKTNELKHLEVENNTLKTKLQGLNETTVFNEERMKKAFQDMEEHIRKLEDERRDLVKVESTQRSNISQLEEDYKRVKEQFKQTQNELANQKANYNQLKLLHEQTDRALSDSQAQIVRAETELATYQSRVRDSTRDTAVYDREIAKLTSDIQLMKNQLTKIDKEKDELLNNLDEKTERIAFLEDELSSKNKSVTRLEGELKELKRKLSKYADENSTQEHLTRSTRNELTVLEQDYDKEKRLKEAALLENRRLQQDLTAVTCDSRDARNELEISRRQVEDLKRQLQHYVAEVKRTEDLISGKELERAELLDQFRCLSQEADILETTNHTLENEATQSRVQLSVALDHTSDLERRLENQECIIRSYEKQISELTTQVASLEMQLKQNNREHEHYSTEIKQMRDLCVKLDKDKDTLKHELYSKDDYRAQIEKATEKLESEKQTLQRTLEKDRTSLEALEKLLNEARQEVIDQRLLNQDMQSEVSRLKQKIAELQERVNHSDLDEPQKKSEITHEQRSKRAARDIVHFDDNQGEAKRQSHALHPPYRDQSAASTKTLLKDYGYHGSDGVFHGAIDLTQLDNSQPPSRAVSAVSTKTLTYVTKYHGSDGALHGTVDLMMLDDKTQVPLRGVAALSANTLTPSRKYHGSDNSLEGNIDLTRLDSENVDCHEQCDRVQCPLHKRMFSKANLYEEDEFEGVETGGTKAEEKNKKKPGSLDQNKDIRPFKTAHGEARSATLESEKQKPQEKKQKPDEKKALTQAEDVYYGSYEIFSQVYSPPISPPPLSPPPFSGIYHSSNQVVNEAATVVRKLQNEAHNENNQTRNKDASKNVELHLVPAPPPLKPYHEFYDPSRKENNQTKKDTYRSAKPKNSEQHPAAPPRSLDVYHGSYEIFNQARLNYPSHAESNQTRNTDASKNAKTKNLESHPAASPPSFDAYHGSYEIFNQAGSHKESSQTKKTDTSRSAKTKNLGAHPAASPPSFDAYHGSYEIFNQAGSHKESNQTKQTDTSRSAKTKNLEAHPAASPPSFDAYHGSYEIFNQAGSHKESNQTKKTDASRSAKTKNLEAHPAASPPSFDAYHGSYEIFNQAGSHKESNQTKKTDTSRSAKTKNLEAHPAASPPPFDAYHGSYEIFNQAGCYKENTQTKKTDTSRSNNVNSETKDVTNYSTHVDDPKSVLCKGLKNTNINSKKQSNNLCARNKCLEKRALSHSLEENYLTSKTRVLGASASNSYIADYARHFQHPTPGQSAERPPLSLRDKNSGKPAKSSTVHHSETKGGDEGKTSSEQNTKSSTSTAQHSGKLPVSNAIRSAPKNDDNQKSSGQAPKQVVPPGVSYDIIWNKCNCQECWSNVSASEPNMGGQCLSKGLTAKNKCGKKNAAEKIKDRVRESPKSPSEKNNRPEATTNKNIIYAAPSGGCVKSSTVQHASKKPDESTQTNNKLSKTTCTHCNAQAQFSQDGDDSAEFRKVFSINGVGLQCHCRISSFKTQD